MTNYVQLIENNDNEGESWKFFIPVEGNEENLEKLAEMISVHNDEMMFDNYELVLDKKFNQEEVKVLEKLKSTTGYMKEYNVLEGKLSLPQDIEEDLYKGGIVRLMS